MATIDSILSKISGLISKSNTTTGRTDADLTSAVDALIGGYGTGGETTPSTGMNIRMFTTTVSADVTSGDYVIAPANDFLASIRSDPNAFVWMWMVDPPASTAMYSIWILMNQTLIYTGSTAKNTLLVRTTASANNITFNSNGLGGANYVGHLNVNADGSLTVRGCNTTYPVKAGTYKILAGTLETL